jgi:hypothetical protein
MALNMLPKVGRRHAAKGNIIRVNKGFDLVAADMHPKLTKGGRLRAVVQHSLINGEWAISVHVRASRSPDGAYNDHWHCIYREPANPPENDEAVQRLKEAMADMLSLANGGIGVKLLGRQS